MNMENEEDYGLERLFREGLTLEEYIENVVHRDKLNKTRCELIILSDNMNLTARAYSSLMNRLDEVKLRAEELGLHQEFPVAFDEFRQVYNRMDNAMDVDCGDWCGLQGQVKEKFKETNAAFDKSMKLEAAIKAAAERCVSDKMPGYYCGICETVRPNVLMACGHQICIDCLFRSHNGKTDDNKRVMRLNTTLNDYNSFLENNLQREKPVVYVYRTYATGVQTYMFKCPWCQQVGSVTGMRLIRN